MKRPWTATYRLQLSASFTFDDVADIAPYLADLGISHVYLSPVLQAAPGSTHGYDCTDPSRLSSDLGGPEAYERACEALGEHRIGQLLDIVPNHMAAHAANPWWWDVLRHGRDSVYAAFFDLRWQAATPMRPAAPQDAAAATELAEMLPHPEDVEGPEEQEEDREEKDNAYDPYWSAPYYIRLPVLGSTPEQAVRGGELRLEVTEAGVVVRYYEAAFPLAPQTQPRPAAVDEINAEPRLLWALLERQHYRLVYWRTASKEIDYRRFFDINGLAGLRVEDKTVFDASHALVLDLAARERIEGLRVDHIDGLRDPEAYLQRLRAAAPDRRIIVEKVLEADEELPQRWPADGTTGYDFLPAVNGLFVDPQAEAPLTNLYEELTGEAGGYGALLDDTKRYVLDQLFAGDVAHVARLFQATEGGTAWDRSDIEAALRETIVALPVYRTYVQPERNEVHETDRRLIEGALSVAGSRLPRLDRLLLDRLRAILLLERRGEAESDFVLSFQQICGPAMAKGAEDTAFYNYHRLVSLNEVGGNPGRFGATPGRFHQACQLNAERWPLTMLATSTHDTKRGEDVRLRIDAISEMAPEWSDLVRGWMRDHERYCRNGRPDANARYLLYQTLAGAWPIEVERICDYMIKATREAKVYTSWLNVTDVYEEATLDYIERVLADPQFCEECEAFAGRLAGIAGISSLAQTLIKLTAPGVPDFYQGSELWEMSLVDPDNRRPVDYDTRRRLLEEAQGMTASEALEGMAEGLPKLWLIWKVLQLRLDRPELFAGPYAPVRASGPHQDSIIAFMRGGVMMTVAPRLTERIEADDGATAISLPAGRWRNALTGSKHRGGEVPVEGLLKGFPVALLIKENAR